jgi:hypothetical protein
LVYCAFEIVIVQHHTNLLYENVNGSTTTCEQEQRNETLNRENEEEEEKCHCHWNYRTSFEDGTEEIQWVTLGWVWLIYYCFLVCRKIIPLLQLCYWPVDRADADNDAALSRSAPAPRRLRLECGPVRSAL